MILLDTNVLSALMRTTPDAAVVAWLDRQPVLSVWTTAVTVLEIRHGLALLPAGRRRTALAAGFDRLVDSVLDRRVAAFDAAAACRAVVATGNTRHFADLSIPAVDPWAAVE